jgi:hypothetical protein
MSKRNYFQKPFLHDMVGNICGCGRKTQGVSPRRSLHSGYEQTPARVATVQIAFYDFIDDWPEQPVFLLKALLIVGQKPVKINALLLMTLQFM